VHVNEPGAEITVYELIEAPPFDTGAVHDTTDWLLAAPVATTPVGAPGTVDGTTADDAVEAEPVPDTFVAVTVNVYGVPLARPVTEQLVAPLATHVAPPGDAVTVYELIAAPPLLAGADHDTTDREFSADVADRPVGAPGTVDGTTDNDATDAALEPDTFVAVTLKEYAMPLVRPVTVHDVDAVVHVNEPGAEVTVYEEIEAPPVETGAVHDTTD